MEDMADSESSPSGTRTLNQNTIHRLLSDEQRRHVLSCLTDHGSMALPDLADEVAAREHDASLPQVPDDAVLTTYLTLYHTHIPKLAEADVVRYDQDQDLVALGEHADRLRAYSSSAYNRSQPPFYLPR